MAALASFQTGQPYSVISAIDVNEDGNLTDRIDSTAGLSFIEEGRARLGLASGTASSSLLAAQGSPGKLGRNTFRAQGIVNVDVSVLKQFRFSDRQRFEFRTEAFNLFNRPHFGIPVRTLESPGFGQSIDTVGDARRIQFAFKYLF